MAVYPTGYSNQPIDFSGATNALLKSAMQSKIQEIKSKSEELSQNEKFILKAMDITTIPEISGKLRDRFDTEINDLRNKTTQIFRQRDGSLTSSDKAQIEKMNIELQNKMNLAKNNLGKIAELNKVVTNPASRSAFKLEPFSLELGQLVDKFDKGEDVGTELTALPMKHAIIPSEEELVAQSIKKNGIKFDDIKTIQVGSNGKYIYTTATEEESMKNKIKNAIKLDSAVNWKYQKEMPDGSLVWNEDEIDKTATNMIPMYAVKKVEEKPIPTRGSGGGGVPKIGTGLVAEYSQSPIGSETLDIKLPTTSTVTEDFGTVYDENGSPIRMGTKKATPKTVKMDKDGRLWVEYITEGGVKKDKDGNPVYSTIAPEAQDNKSKRISESDMKALAESNANTQLTRKKGFKIDASKEPEIVKNEDGSVDYNIHIIRPFEKKWIKDDVPEAKEVITYKFYPLQDKNEFTTFAKEVKGQDRQKFLSTTFQKVKVEGTNKTLWDVLTLAERKQLNFDEIKASSPVQEPTSTNVSPKLSNKATSLPE